MDALFRIMGAVGDGDRQLQLTTKYRAIRIALSGFSFSSDDDLAPALLLAALMECRQQTCSIVGITTLISEVYARPVKVQVGAVLGGSEPGPQAATPVPPPGTGPTPPAVPLSSVVVPADRHAEGRLVRVEMQAQEIVTALINCSDEPIDQQTADAMVAAVLAILTRPSVH